MNKKDKKTVDIEEPDMTNENLTEEVSDSVEEKVVDFPDPDIPLEEKLQAELCAAQDQLLRARADFDNFRKRKAREIDQVRKTAAEALIQDILPALDNLNLTLDHVEDPDSNLATGVTMVVKQLMDVLDNRGLTIIDALGKPFDPNLHDAMTQLPSEEYEKDFVMQVFQKGYMLRDTILRPSKVVVSSGPPEADEESNETPEETATAE